MCQSTNKQVNCAPDKHFMESECSRRLTRPPACFCQTPILPGPPTSQLRSNDPPSLPSERQTSRFECLPDYSRCLSTDECPPSNSAVCSDIRSANPRPNVRLACPKPNTRKRTSHTLFPPPICNLCNISSVGKARRFCASCYLYFHTSCHKPTPPSELAIHTWKCYACLPHVLPRSTMQN